LCKVGKEFLWLREIVGWVFGVKLRHFGKKRDESELVFQEATYLDRKPVNGREEHNCQ